MSSRQEIEQRADAIYESLFVRTHAFDIDTKAAEGIAKIETYLAKHAAFYTYYKERSTA